MATRKKNSTRKTTKKAAKKAAGKKTTGGRKRPSIRLSPHGEGPHAFVVRFNRKLVARRENGAIVIDFDD